MPLLLAGCGGGSSGGTGEAPSSTVIADDQTGTTEETTATPPEPEPAPEPEPQPEDVAQENAEPKHIVRTSVDGVTVYVLDFSTSERGRLELNALFRNNSQQQVDVLCKVAILSGFNEVDFTFISVGDIAPGDTVPDQTLFLEDGITTNSFDTVRVSGCFTVDSNAVTASTPEPDFSYITRIAFEDAEAFVLGYDFDQFGRFLIRGLIKNNGSTTVDVLCRVTLLSGNYVADFAFISASDVNPGETVPDSTTLIDDTITVNSFDRVRLSDCFTI